MIGHLPNASVLGEARVVYFEYVMKTQSIFTENTSNTKIEKDMETQSRFKMIKT